MAVAFANLISRQHENSKEVSFRIDITECDSGYLRTIGKIIYHSISVKLQTTLVFKLVQ